VRLLTKDQTEAPKLLGQLEVKRGTPKDGTGWLVLKSQFRGHMPMGVLVDYYSLDGKLIRTSPSQDPSDHPGLVGIVVSTISSGETLTIQVPVGVNEMRVGGDELCPWISPRVRFTVQSGQAVKMTCGTHLNSLRWKLVTMRALFDNAFYDAHSDEFIFLQPSNGPSESSCK
jgi:hypothetical protein